MPSLFVPGNFQILCIWKNILLMDVYKSLSLCFSSLYSFFFSVWMIMWGTLLHRRIPSTFSFSLDFDQEGHFQDRHQNRLFHSSASLYVVLIVILIMIAMLVVHLWPLNLSNELLAWVVLWAANDSSLHLGVEFEAYNVREWDFQSTLSHFSCYSRATFHMRKSVSPIPFQVMVPKCRSSRIIMGESSTPSTDIHPRKMRLRSWTNPKLISMSRPLRIPIGKLGHLVDPMPIIIDSSDSKNNPPVINSLILKKIILHKWLHHCQRLKFLLILNPSQLQNLS